MKSNYKWIIIGGCPRSGTTLLNLILNKHDLISITNEVSLVTLIKNIKSLYRREEKVKNIICRKKTEKENWNLEELKLLVPSFEKSSMKVLETIYEEQFKSNNKYFGDKYPKYYTQDLSIIKDFFEDIYIIHISRNPINVINSMLRRADNTKKGTDYWKGTSTLDECLEEWCTAWNFIQNNKKYLNILHVKYEDILFNTSSFFSSISNFLNLDFKNLEEIDLIIKKDDEINYLTKAEIDYINTYLYDIPIYWNNMNINELENHILKGIRNGI